MPETVKYLYHSGSCHLHSVCYLSCFLVPPIPGPCRPFKAVLTAPEPGVSVTFLPRGSLVERGIQYMVSSERVLRISYQSSSSMSLGYDGQCHVFKASSRLLHTRLLQQ